MTELLITANNSKHENILKCFMSRGRADEYSVQTEELIRESICNIYIYKKRRYV